MHDAVARSFSPSPSPSRSLSHFRCCRCPLLSSMLPFLAAKRHCFCYRYMYSFLFFIYICSASFFFLSSFQKRKNATFFSLSEVYAQYICDSMKWLNNLAYLNIHKFVQSICCVCVGVRSLARVCVQNIKKNAFSAFFTHDTHAHEYYEIEKWQTREKTHINA